MVYTKTFVRISVKPVGVIIFWLDNVSQKSMGNIIETTPMF